MFGTRFSLKEQGFFFKRLSYLMNAHISLFESLQVLEGQSDSKKHRKMFRQIILDVSQGQSLSRSFKKFPRIFNEFSISIITVGEKTGTLPANLAYLAEELKKKQLLKSKVVSAFVYPALITIATLGITAFLMLFLFPKITPIFTSLHADLPLSTKIVMASSVALQEWGIYFIVGAVGVSFLLSLLLQKNFNARLWFNRLCLKLPIVGTVIVYYNCSNISRTLGLLLKSGVTLTNALITSAKATPNLVYKNELIILSHVVERGDLMSLYLKKQPAYFPEVLCHMVAVGEKSGTLSNTLLYLAENYDNEVDEFTKNISTLVEPVLMIFMGILIGFIAISIITPIYGITQNLHG